MAMLYSTSGLILGVRSAFTPSVIDPSVVGEVSLEDGGDNPESAVVGGEVKEEEWPPSDSIWLAAVGDSKW
jgi:hypothetical protein